MSYKDMTEKLRLIDFFTEKYPYDKEFMEDLLMQCHWSKSQTTKSLEEMKKADGSQEKKDNATGQKADSLSPTQKGALPNQSPSFKLLDAKAYRLLIEREGLFRFTFFLGEVQFGSEKLRNFAPRVFFESAHLKYLSERLNWWVKLGNYAPLGPLKTRGDGNCLLHAVSRALIGVEDEELVLRGMLYRFLTDKLAIRLLKDRWKQQQASLNGRAGFEFDASEWENEWQTVLSLASPDASLPEAPSASETDTASPPLAYKSLEEIHVFALAHVIRRPIIVLADSVLQDVEGTAMSPVYFGGVYLPLDREPDQCYKIPVVLTYCCSHFAPLVPCYNDLLSPGMNTEACKEVVVPLVDHRGDMLPIQFLYDHEWRPHSRDPDFPFISYSKAKQSILREHLYLEELLIPRDRCLVAAKIFPSTHEFHSEIVGSLVRLSETKLQEYTAKKARELKEREAKALPSNPPPASPRTHGYYSRPQPTSAYTSSILPTPISRSKDKLSAKTDPLPPRTSTCYSRPDSPSRIYSHYSRPDSPSRISSHLYSSPSTVVDPISRTMPLSRTRQIHSYAASSKPVPYTSTDPLSIRSDPLSLHTLNITPSSKLPTTSIDSISPRHYTLPVSSHKDTILYPPNSNLSLTEHTSTRNKSTNTGLSSEYSKVSTNSLTTFHDPLTDASYRHRDPTTSLSEPYPMNSKSSPQEYLGRRKKERPYDVHVEGEILELAKYLNSK